MARSTLLKATLAAATLVALAGAPAFAGTTDTVTVNVTGVRSLSVGTFASTQGTINRGATGATVGTSSYDYTTDYLDKITAQIDAAHPGLTLYVGTTALSTTAATIATVDGSSTQASATGQAVTYKVDTTTGAPLGATDFVVTYSLVAQ